MRKTLCLILAVLLFGSFAFAETQLSVSGTGTVQISADYAVVTVGVTSSEKTVMDAQSKTNAVISKIKAALYELGIEETDISLDHIGIYSYYDSSYRKEDYRATQNLQIKVNNLSGIGEVIDAAFKAGANNLGGIEYFSSDTSEARDKAIQLAVTDARSKADVLASSLGLKIAGVVSASQSAGYSSQVLASNYSFTLDSYNTGDYTPTLVQPDKITVSVNVSIVFSAEAAE